MILGQVPAGDHELHLAALVVQLAERQVAHRAEQHDPAGDGHRLAVGQFAGGRDRRPGHRVRRVRVQAELAQLRHLVDALLPDLTQHVGPVGLIGLIGLVGLVLARAGGRVARVVLG
jgi:hypothetical protein